MSKGASADADRALAVPAEPEVSALRASIPSAELIADNTTFDLLSEALDLCCRARALDDVERACLEQRMGRFGETRCIAPALWVSRQYEADLAEWEEKARNHLGRRLRYVGGTVPASGIEAPSGETAKTGSTVGESPAPEGGDAR